MQVPLSLFSSYQASFHRTFHHKKNVDSSHDDTRFINVHLMPVTGITIRVTGKKSLTVTETSQFLSACYSLIYIKTTDFQ